VLAKIQGPYRFKFKVFKNRSEDMDPSAPLFSPMDEAAYAITLEKYKGRQFKIKSIGDSL